MRMRDSRTLNKDSRCTSVASPLAHCAVDKRGFELIRQQACLKRPEIFTSFTARQSDGVESFLLSAQLLFKGYHVKIARQKSEEWWRMK